MRKRLQNKIQLQILELLNLYASQTFEEKVGGKGEKHKSN